MYYLNGPKTQHTMHVSQTARKRRAAMHGFGDARYDPRLFPSDPIFPPVYGNYVNKQVSIPEGWWYPHPFTHYFHFDTAGLDGLGNWMLPWTWGWLKGALNSGNTTYYSDEVDPVTGEPLPGAKGTKTEQGWLASIFGALGSLFKKSTGQTGTKTTEQISLEAQLAAKKKAEWNASALGMLGFPDTILGIDTNLALILGAVGAAGIFFAMKQGGGAQQPIMVVPGLQQQPAKKNPRRRRHSGRRIR